MDDFLFAHLADAHVGAWPRDGAIRAALRESVVRAISTVEERGCEFLLISGDLFHTPVPDPSEAAPVAAALRRLTDRGRRIYVIYGSHDYVAHRTSWLDVLAESGLFLRAAPSPVRAEGERWTLPFLTDGPTGCRIAGVSGRAQGLDRGYFLGIDAESYRTGPAFRIFQFHAAVREYLPPALREHMEGISVEELPEGADYYAGGHIHGTYEGPGPRGRGLLVNPGAVFGTSVTDIAAAVQGRTHRGVAIVRVRAGVPAVEFVDTAPRDMEIVDIELHGETAEVARTRIDEAVERRRGTPALLFPRIHGTLADGSIGGLGLRRTGASGGEAGGPAIHWDVSDLTTVGPGATEAPASTDELERDAVRRLAAELPEGLARAGAGERLLREILHELGRPLSEGEARADYEASRIDAVRQALAREAPRTEG